MNAKIYEYDTKVYRTKITITAIFCAFILAYSLFSIFTKNVPESIEKYHICYHDDHSCHIGKHLKP